MKLTAKREMTQLYKNSLLTRKLSIRMNIISFLMPDDKIQLMTAKRQLTIYFEVTKATPYLILWLIMILYPLARRTKTTDQLHLFNVPITINACSPNIIYLCF